MKLLTKEKILTISMLLGAAAAILFGGFGEFARQCEEMPQKLFRLHIPANSDSVEDQKLKYDLRDYILDYMQDVFAGCSTAEEAKEAAKANLPQITQKAQEFVNSQGVDETVSVSVENMYFTTRRYGSYVVPAGNYDALRIVIGEGQGRNWWCVMFPPLCLGAVEEDVELEQDMFLCKAALRKTESGRLSFAASRRIESDQPVQIRFKLFQWLEECF